MIKGYSLNGMGKIALGTHLGDFSKEDSEKYVQAISYSLTNGINTIDGAINYRGMSSEKDIGFAIRELLSENKIKREDIFITSKAGLLFGDIQEKINPMKYLTEILEPEGVSIDDFTEYEGLYQTLNPLFYEIALKQSIKNLGLETIDVHYIHIPEISKLSMPIEEFYDKMEKLFAWYETKVQEGFIRHYGIALEFMVEEPSDEKWHFEIEELVCRARKVAKGESHFKYVLFEYNKLCTSAQTVKNQKVASKTISLADACHEFNLETVGSMPFAMGDCFAKYTVEELVEFALSGVDHVIFGSKNINHIKEIYEIAEKCNN